MRANEDIRKAAADNKIKHWQIAKLLGISEGNFCRRLRQELSSSEKIKTLQAIERLAHEKQRSER